MKNVILWNFSRGTWQYDIFCLLIIAFIFLTPNIWFGERKDPANLRKAKTVQEVRSNQAGK